MSGIIKVLTFSEGLAVLAPTQSLISGSGGMVGSGEWRSNTNSPINDFQDGQNIQRFDKLSSQEIFRTIKVPNGYATGSQIFLTGGGFYTQAVTGKVKFKTTTTLIRNGITVLGTYPNQYSSTNLGVIVDATPYKLKSIGNIDLTNSSGQINGQDPQAGDSIVIKLFRDCASESPQADADVLINVDNFDLIF